MASQAQIATQACLDVGGQAISDVDNETQKEAALIREIWDISLDEVLATHEWGFAKKSKALALDGSFTDPVDNWEYIYAFPSDYIKMLKNNNNFDHEVKQGRLYTDTEDLIIEYIARIEDTSKFPIWFVTALVAKLRTRLSIPLAKRSSKTVEWFQLYQIELNQAKSDDFKEDQLSDDDSIKHTADNDSWVGVATT